jgi:hypothetical protein
MESSECNFWSRVSSTEVCRGRNWKRMYSCGATQRCSPRNLRSSLAHGSTKKGPVNGEGMATTGPVRHFRVIRRCRVNTGPPQFDIHSNDRPLKWQSVYRTQQVKVKAEHHEWETRGEGSNKALEGSRAHRPAWPSHLIDYRIIPFSSAQSSSTGVRRMICHCCLFELLLIKRQIQTWWRYYAQISHWRKWSKLKKEHATLHTGVT